MLQLLSVLIECNSLHGMILDTGCLMLDKMKNLLNIQYLVSRTQHLVSRSNVWLYNWGIPRFTKTSLMRL